MTHLKAGEHTFIIPLKDEIAMLLGQIVVYWGAFELRMDLLIETVSARLNKEPPVGWKTMNFKKRKELFRDIMRDYTTQLFPQLSATFNSIAGTAADLHWRRNLVAHGYYQVIPDAKPNEQGICGTSYTAHGLVNDKPKFIAIDAKTLEKLWHDISHLNGKMLAALNVMGGKMTSLDLVIPDTDLLQDQQSGNFRLLPISEQF